MNTPRILFFNINGSGMGHMSRCLAYAKRLRGKADISFFSLASAMEFIEHMGFQGEYFVSQFWADASNSAWNKELCFRLGLFLDHIQPEIIVFDGTWPYGGFRSACSTYGKARLVWSYRGLFKKGIKKAPVSEKDFSLVIKPGELGDTFSQEILSPRSKKIFTPPVTLLEEAEFLDMQTARASLGLEAGKRYALFSLGPGNLKDVHSLGHRLIQAFQEAGFHIVFACAPISVQDVDLPPTVSPLSVYPLAQYMRAFDVFVGAAGYNTCCEVMQAGIPTLFIPNTLVADDQTRRAHLVGKHAPVVVSPCESNEEIQLALQKLMALSPRAQHAHSLPLDGATCAANAILALAQK